MAYKKQEQYQEAKNAWGGNVALAHENGSLTDEQIKKMTDGQLLLLAYADPARRDGIRMEWYRRTSDKKLAEEQGGRAGENFLGVHRALLEIEHRAKQLSSAAEERRRINSEALQTISTPAN